MWEAFRSWKRQRSEFPLEPPEGTQLHQHLDFSQIKHMSRFRTPEFNIINLFQSTKFVVTCYSCSRKLIQCAFPLKSWDCSVCVPLKKATVPIWQPSPAHYLGLITIPLPCAFRPLPVGFLHHC